MRFVKVGIFDKIIMNLLNHSRHLKLELLEIHAPQSNRNCKVRKWCHWASLRFYPAIGTPSF